ncbi:MAG: hypothetical protein PHP06_10990 [Clostridia bacterium]|nr:hypothetical protein [Clostridia bacterium]
MKKNGYLRQIAFTYKFLSLVGVPLSLIAPLAVLRIISNEAPPYPVPIILSVIAVLSLVFSLAMCVCLFLSAKYIRERKHPLFINIISAILCLSFPIGTVIGILALVTINSNEVKETFAN